MTKCTHKPKSNRIGTSQTEAATHSRTSVRYRVSQTLDVGLVRPSPSATSHRE